MSAALSVVTVTGERGIGKSSLVRSVLHSLDGHDIAVSHLDLADVPDKHALSHVRGYVASMPLQPRFTGEPRRSLLVVDHAEALATSARNLLSLAPDPSALTLLLESVRDFPPASERAQVRLGPLGIEDCAELFRRVARSCGRTFDHDPATVELIARISHAVDGNPLALELAAWRTKVMPLEDLHGLLSSPRGALSVLSTPLERRFHRHRSRASDGVLPEAGADGAEVLLEYVSVFAGSFSRDAMEAVVGDDVPHLFDALAELLDEGLVQVEGDTPERRFRLSRLVRTLARARLAESGALRTAEDRHSRYFAARAHQAALAVFDADEDSARVLLGDDGREAYEALERLTETHPAAALQLAADLAWDAPSRGTGAMLAQLLERLVDDVTTANLAARRDALLWLVQLTSWLPDALDRRELIRRHLDESMTAARDIGEPHALLRALRVRFLAVTIDGDVAGAMAACVEGMELAQRIGHVRWLGRFEISLSSMHGLLQQWDIAAPLASSGLSRALRSEDRRAVVLATLVLHSAPPGSLTDTVTLPSLEAVLSIARDVGDATSESHALAALAHRAIESGDHDAAVWWVTARQERIGRAELLHGLTVSTMLAVHIAHLRGDFDRAARLHAAIASPMESVAAVFSPHLSEAYTAMLHDVRQQLSPERFDAESAIGRLFDRAQTLSELTAYLERARSEPARTSPTSPAMGADNGPDGALLTPREQQVLRLVARGFRNKEIAAELRVTPKTVMHHTVSIYRKLGVRGRSEAATHPVARQLSASA